MIRREDQGGVAIMRLAHGPVNAMDLELLEAIALEFRELPGSATRSVVLTGTGRVFSAGVDLKRYTQSGPEYARELPRALSSAFEAVFRCPLPVIAAINGHAIAGGCVLACCADWRLMADGSGRIGTPEIRVGVPFPRTALEIMRHTVGQPNTRRLALGAETYPPAEALALDLVDEVVGMDDLLPHAVAAATRMSDASPADTFSVTKAQLHRDTVERIDCYREDEDRIAQRLWLEHAAVDGWAARYLDSLGGRG